LVSLALPVLQPHQMPRGAGTKRDVQIELPRVSFRLAGAVMPEKGGHNRVRSAHAIVMEAEVHLDVDATEIPSIAELSVAVGVSRRTLERAFREVLDMSPGEYIRVRASTPFGKRC
jgi:AraC-like DNA-binding protein